MNKTIITLLDSNIEENIQLAGLLIPKEAYLKECRFDGRVRYQISKEKGSGTNSINILNARGEHMWYLWISGYSFIDTGWYELYPDLII